MTAHQPADLMCLLSHPEEPRPDATPHDAMLALLSGAARAGSPFGYGQYSRVQEACRQLWGDDALHARFQAKLHYALLHPTPVHELPALAASARHAIENTPAQRALLLQALRDLAEQEPLQSHDRATRPPEHLASMGETPLHAILPTIEHVLDDTIPLQDSENFFTAFCKRTLSSFIEPPTDVVAEEEALHAPETAEPLVELDHMATTLGDVYLHEDIRQFRAVFRAQPFTIVVTGERKRGKSAVVNTILGCPLSPMREATPETSTLIRFRRADTSGGTAVFLSAEDIATMEQAGKDDPENILLHVTLNKRRAAMEHDLFVPGGHTTLPSLESLRTFARADGPYAGLVAYVDVDIADSMLGKGIVLVDTPGLNDTDPFLAGKAAAAALAADCVVFVMDARDPGSCSELALLRRMAHAGRSISVIGVLTNSDRLESPDSLIRAKAQALSVLQEACRTSGRVWVGGVVALNARMAVEERQNLSARATPSAGSGEVAQLFGLLHEALQRDTDVALRRGKAHDALARLVRHASTSLDQRVDDALRHMPNEALLRVFENQATQLAEVTEQSLTRARQVADMAQADMDAWEEAVERDLEHFRETLILRLMDAIHSKTLTLGRGFAKAGVWREFDESEARILAKQAVDAFLDEQRAVLRGWEDKLRAFSQNMAECARSCLTAASSTLAELDNGTLAPMNADPGAATHFLVQTRHYMTGLAVFAGGAALGRASILTPLALLVSAGNMLALAIGSPILAAVLAAVAGTAGVLYHLGNEEKRRATFLARRRTETERYADRIVEALRQELATARSGVADLYANEVRVGFMPTLESLFCQAVHQRGFVEVMRLIRLEAEDFRQAGRQKIAALEELPEHTQHT